MKIKNNIFLLLFVLIIGTFFASLSFMSCKNEAILASIEEEVALKNFSVSSTLIGFAQVGDDLFVANSETLFTKKKNTLTEWQSISAPSDAKLIQKIAGNGKTIFVSFNEGGVYSYKNKAWKKVANSDKIQAVFGTDTMFGYDLYNKKLYEVKESGVTELSKASFSEGEYLVSAAGSYYSTSGKVNGKSVGKVYSTKDYKLVPALKDLSNIKSVSLGPNNTIFILTDKDIYQYDGTNLYSKNIEDSEKKPLSVFYFAEKDSVLISCSKKFIELKLKKKSLKDAVEVPLGSESSIIPPSVYPQFNSAIGKFSFGSMFVLSSKDGKSYSVFATISAGSLIKNTGLWGYHSFAEKPEWNRE